MQIDDLLQETCHGIKGTQPKFGTPLILGGNR